MRLRLFMAVDGLAHVLNRVGILPDRATGWLCDRFDLWLGVTPDELRRTAP